MGGYGSGRTSYRGVLDSCRRLDVNRWHGENMFVGCQSGTRAWFDEDGEQVASIGYTSSADHVELFYTVAPGTEDAHELRYRVWVVWTPCTFGGERPWFGCPNGSCGRRVGKLYLCGEYFVCRHCTCRGYESQRENRSDRLMRRARRIRQRLGASMNLSEPVWQKPKGMWWRTFERLREEEEWASHGSLVMALQRLGIWA